MGAARGQSRDETWTCRDAACSGATDSRSSAGLILRLSGGQSIDHHGIWIVEEVWSLIYVIRKETGVNATLLCEVEPRGCKVENKGKLCNTLDILIDHCISVWMCKSVGYILFVICNLNILKLYDSSGKGIWRSWHDQSITWSDVQC